MPSSICVSRAPLKSSTIANRLSGNTRSPARPASSAGPRTDRRHWWRPGPVWRRNRDPLRLCPAHCRG